jgi:hypothetical protein
LVEINRKTPKPTLLDERKKLNPDALINVDVLKPGKEWYNTCNQIFEIM